MADQANVLRGGILNERKEINIPAPRSGSASTKGHGPAVRAMMVGRLTRSKTRGWEIHVGHRRTAENLGTIRIEKLRTTECPRLALRGAWVGPKILK